MDGACLPRGRKDPGFLYLAPEAMKVYVLSLHNNAFLLEHPDFLRGSASKPSNRSIRTDNTMAGHLGSKGIPVHGAPNGSSRTRVSSRACELLIRDNLSARNTAGDTINQAIEPWQLPFLRPRSFLSHR